MRKVQLAFFLALGFLPLIALGIFYSLNSTSNDPDYQSFNPSFEESISAYTVGNIPRTAAVHVQFSENYVADDIIGEALDQSPFSFSPSIKGKAKWSDSRTVSFVPDEPLPSGEVFQADLHVTELGVNTPVENSTFKFQFNTRPQSLDVAVTESRTQRKESREYQTVSGIVRTVDFETDENIEKMVSAKLGTKAVDIKWDHSKKDNSHSFDITGLERKSKPYRLNLFWNGDKMGVSSKGEQAIEIPAKGVFRLMETYSYKSPEQYAVLEFSDEIDKNQDLKGLIRMKQTQLDFSVDGNRIKVFPKTRIAGPIDLKVEPGIRSIKGDKTDLAKTETIEFSEAKPEVRLVGKGTIIPKANTLPFIFEAVGLKAVDVRVIKIVEKNIPQFLQVNQLNDNREMQRVGKLLVSEKVELNVNKELDLNTWNRHSIDLSKLIQTEPGAIYEVAIAYRKSYSLYACSEEEREVKDRNLLATGKSWNGPSSGNESSYWDYYYYDYEDYENPCKSAYYSKDKIARRNVLASDLGLLAKRGSSGSFYVVTDLKTTNPMPDVKLDIYDYQHQLITTATTDAKGMVRSSFDKVPFLMIARSGAQRGYLRMDDGSSLSMSRFDTQGKKYFKGVKGFIYGERGVWRPGDPMHISFILEDKEKTLPTDHPVIFELIDAKGQRVERTVRTQGLNGFYTFLPKTAADAPTGNYLAKVSVGGATFQKSLKVETIIPNRLKLELDFGQPYLSNETQSTSGDLTVKWLHGAIGKNLKADAKVSLVSTPTTFPKYQAFNFDDPVRKFSSEEKTLFDGKLDEKGVAKIPAKISTNKDAPGKLVANFNIKAFEPSGAFSVDRFSIPFHPYSTYVGVKTPKGDARRNMLLTDTDHNVQIVTVDTDGKPVSSKVEVKLYKLNWKWWWDKSADNIGIYKGKVSATELQSDNLTTVNGEASWKMNVKYPEWGRYLVRVTDENGHASGKIVYIDWPGWAGRSTDKEGGGLQMLNFSAEKETHKVGEEVTLNIPTGNAGRALVSVENGSKVIAAYWVDATKGTTRFSFPTTPDMAPNVFVNITLLQPHAQTKNDLPIRMYGVIPVKVEDPTTHLKPVLTMKDKLEPNESVAIKVSESNGKPMTYTVAMVDEGLLDLTRFKTPNPWSSFYQRQGLDVKTWDIFDQVLGAFGGEVKSMLSIGGDGSNEGPSGKKADRFKPVVEFLGPFELKAGATASHIIKLPNYVGSVRTMVVAGNPKGAYGATEKATPVKKPLMVLGTLPRVIGPGERFQLPVTVFAMEDNIKMVNINIKAGKQISVEGSEDQVMRFYEVGEKMTTFELGVLGSLGKTSVQITARSGSQTAVYDAEIEVRNPNPRVTDVFAKVVAAGESWEQAYTPVGMSGTNNGVIEVSSTPPLNLGKRLKYLIRYPYGCIEQTTSGAFPQVFLSSLMELNPTQKSKVDKNIRDAINRLKSFQISSGGLAYWPGQSKANVWGTNYAGHFLLEAQQMGYTLPEGMLKNWKRYQKSQAQNWSNSDNQRDQLTQAYRLFLLALADSPEMGAMNRMKQSKNLSVVAKWELAAAYYLAGQKKVAAKMTKDLSTDVQPYTELSNTYGSGIRDQGVILYALSVMDDRDRATSLVQSISDRLSANKWLNTQATAYCLIGMSKYLGAGDVGDKMKFSYQLKNGKWIDVNGSAPIWQIDLESVSKGTLNFKNKGSGILYPRLILDGIPMTGDQSIAANGLTLDISYTTINGTTLNPDKLEQGTDFKATVKLKNTGTRDYEEMALSQIFPSGWEIHNARMDGSTPSGDTPTYQDYRDDRVYTFFNIKAEEEKTFEVLLNASYLGKYYLPTVTAEAMYDASINARKPGKWVEVVEEGQGG